MPTLRGINFPPIMNASGARGFFPKENKYWYHAPYKLLGLSFEGIGFIAKTTTMKARLEPEKKLGNMPMMPDGITPQEWFPKTIILKPFLGIALNAVGLSGPGAENLLARLHWNTLSATRLPWFLSFMSVEKTMDHRLQELKAFVELLLPTIRGFNIPVGLEINFSCPNSEKNVRENDPSLAEEIWLSLDIASPLGIPIQTKLNALAPIPDIFTVSTHPSCDAIVMGNTIPWGAFPDRINWKQLFGSDVSPFEHLQKGAGGLSGPILRPIHCERIRNAREYGITKPIWGCGGIDSPQAVDEYAREGANGIQIGTVCMMRPWQVPRIKQRAYEVF